MSFPNLFSVLSYHVRFGQPPPEIVKDIAPGLEFDADGLPKMDGAAGLPFPGAGGDEECLVM